MHFNAIVSDQELAGKLLVLARFAREIIPLARVGCLKTINPTETYLPAFTRGCVAGGGTRSIMCSYNSVRSQATCRRLPSAPNRADPPRL